MSYASWSVVFGEQPSAAKWNILGTNDASFHDGTGIQAGAILPTHLMSGTSADWVSDTWSPSFTGFSANPVNGLYYYIQIGKLVFVNITMPASGTSNSTAFTLTAPVTARTLANQQWQGYAQVVDSGTNQTTPGLLQINTAGTTINVFKTYAGGTFTGSGAKGITAGSIIYEAA